MSVEPLIAIIDAETTGLAPDVGHEAWEWGLILRDPTAPPHERDVEYLWQVRPDLTHADPVALSKSGYYQRAQLNLCEPGTAKLVQGPDTAKVGTAKGLALLLAPLLDGAVVVGCNPGFDRDFLRPFLRRHGQAYTCHYRPICVTTMAAGFLFGQRAGFGVGWNELAGEVRRTARFHPDWPITQPKVFEPGEGRSLVPMPNLPWSSDGVASSVGVDPSDYDRHTALDDCRFARDQWDAITGGGHG